MDIQQGVQRILTLLRNKIRERGFTQLEVQDKLEWGRSYISQLLTRQKSLRVEQVLMILDVIGVDPADFFAELYHLQHPGKAVSNIDDYAASRAAKKPRRSRSKPAKQAASKRGSEAGPQSEVRQMQAVMRALVDVLVDNQVAKRDDIVAAAQEADQDLDLEFLR